MVFITVVGVNPVGAEAIGFHGCLAQQAMVQIPQQGGHYHHVAQTT